jgi:hypothetical protein
MKRLRDMEGDEPLFQRGVEIIRETPPAPEAADLKQRVWRSIQGAPAPAPRRLRMLMLKTAMGAMVALGAGTAGAVIAHNWIAPRLEDADATTPAPAARAPARREKAIANPPPAPAAETIVERPTQRPAARSTAKKAAPPPALPSAAVVARERTEVLDALVALRREHDAARAGTLLARYLSAHPHGALREEALALAIEAADARGDRAAAAQLAQTYQNEFPSGRFLQFARSHTDGRGSH